MSEPEVILPRELTDISDEVRNVPPPPSAQTCPRRTLFASPTRTPTPG